MLVTTHCQTIFCWNFIAEQARSWSIQWTFGESVRRCCNTQRKAVLDWYSDLSSNESRLSVRSCDQVGTALVAYFAADKFGEEGVHCTTVTAERTVQNTYQKWSDGNMSSDTVHLEVKETSHRRWSENSILAGLEHTGPSSVSAPVSEDRWPKEEFGVTIISAFSMLPLSIPHNDVAECRFNPILKMYVRM